MAGPHQKAPFERSSRRSRVRIASGHKTWFFHNVVRGNLTKRNRVVLFLCRRGHSHFWESPVTGFAVTPSLEKRALGGGLTPLFPIVKSAGRFGGSRFWMANLFTTYNREVPADAESSLFLQKP